MNDRTKFDTKLIHAGEPRPTVDRSVTLPIFQNASFEFGGDDDRSQLKYPRYSNTPNHICVGEKIAAAEGVEAALVTATGMAAITTALLALIGEGKHLLAQEDLYGGTFHFLTETFSRFGRKVSFFPLSDIGRLDAYLTAETAGIYVESVSNPTLRIPDLRGVAEFSRRHRLVSFIDNTFPSPVNFNPSHLGFDVILHSATKYLNGHTDIVGGAVCGSRAAVEQVLSLLKDLGGSMDAHTCFLLNRGLKTLSVRVREQNKTALQLAMALEKHPKVARVLYPGLSSHSDHGRARELFRGFGGMLSFEYRGTEVETEAFLKRLKLAYVAPSLGGVETLVTRPARTSHSSLPVAERERLGIKSTLVRISVGLEDAEDLIADFTESL